MAKIKLTKTELKAQRDALKRFSRYLPTLQLKKQQLELETRRVRDELQKLASAEEAHWAAARPWIGLLDEPLAGTVAELLHVRDFRREVRNIAGVDTPVFEGLEFAPVEVDLFATTVVLDDILAAARLLIEFRLHHRLLAEQLAALEDELRTTSQRVNLFEKVKIPEAKENIRRIHIYLGDEQTNAVGRSKIAKNKTRALQKSL